MNPSLSRRQALAGLGVLATAPLAGCIHYESSSATGSGASQRGTAGAGSSSMNLERTPFGSLADGTPVSLFTFRNAKGTVLKVTNYGLIITELHTPDRNGKPGNVVLGFDNLPRYLAGHPFFGAIAGRVANRIAKGRFTIDGHEYTLAINNGENHLHGGMVGFDKKVWKVEEDETTPAFARVRFSHLSPDGDEGYPGNLKVTVDYVLTADNEVRIHYRATTDKATPINLTNHSYFNLAGQGLIDDHQLQIHGDRYTPGDAGLIPTGELAPVAGTAFDFTTPHAIGERIEKTGLTPTGYDHNFVLNAGGKSIALAARVVEPKSGRVMEVLTDRPGVQLYTANFFPKEGVTCTGGVTFPPHGAFCLETQNFPDAVNKPSFPKSVWRPGEVYDTTTIFRFSAH